MKISRTRDGIRRKRAKSQAAKNRTGKQSDNWENILKKFLFMGNRRKKNASFGRSRPFGNVKGNRIRPEKQTQSSPFISSEPNWKASTHRPTKPTSDNVKISFKPDTITAIVSRMATSAEEMAIGWNGIQAAIVGASNPKALPQYTHLEDIKNGLKLYLTDMIAILQLCLKFANQWKPVAITSDQAELIELVVELVPTAQECSQKAQDLVITHQSSIQNYFDRVSEFESLLSGFQLSGEEEKPTAKFSRTFRELEKGVEDLATFFEEQLKEYARQWNAVKNLDKAAPIKEANQFAKEWTNTQGSLIAAKVRTIKARDNNLPNHAPSPSRRRSLW